MTQVTASDLTNAKLDCDTIAAVATSASETVTDRLGNEKRTLTGAILALGYEAPVAYTAGLDMTNGAQTVEYSGAIYAAKPSAVPFTTSGTFESSSFRLLDSSTATLAAQSAASDAAAAAASASAAATSASNAETSAAAAITSADPLKGLLREKFATSWALGTSAADNKWESVCWSPELRLLCAVASTGTGNRVMTSPDGVTWTTRTSAADNSWSSVCWSSDLGLFCAVAASGTGNRVMTSPDGITWTTRTSASDSLWSSVCWSSGLGLFCAVAGGYPKGGSGTASTAVMTSPDGITWTARTASASKSWAAICWSPDLGLFAATSAVLGGAGIMTSPDGITWTTRATGTYDHGDSICWSPELGLFCAGLGAGAIGGHGFTTSPDGITWTSVSSTSDCSYGICWSSELGMFCSVGQDIIYTSSNGSSFINRSSGFSKLWNSICWAPEIAKFVAVCGTGTGDRVMTSGW